MKEPLTAFYFPHDIGSSNDPKLVYIRQKFGWAGIGIYWALVEVLHKEESGKLPEALFLSVVREFFEREDTGFPKESLLPDFQKCLFDANAFHTDSDGMVTNERVQRNIDIRRQKSEAARESAKARWGAKTIKKDTAMRTHSEGNANAMLVKESKVNERKLKKPFNNEIENGKKPTKTERTETQTLLAFFDVAMKNNWCEKTYRDAKMQQFQELLLADKAEVKEKMDRTLNCTFSEKENIRKLARTMYHETIGLIQDRALDRKTIDGKDLAKRKEFENNETEPF